MSTVLIVDDEAEIRFMLAWSLNGLYTVSSAADGREAMERLAADPVDVVVTDLRMPGAGGLEVLARAHEIDPQLPVVVITAVGTLDSAIEALRLGAYDYILKPIDDFDVLHKSLERALEWRHLRQENLRLMEELKRANAFKARMLRTVAHDICNLLCGVRGNVELAEITDDVGRIRERLHDVQAATSRMQELTEDLSTYSQLEARALELKPAPLDMMDAISEVACVLCLDPRRHRVVLPESAPTAHADSHRTRQVLANLLGNAVKHNPQGCTVTVTADLHDDQVHVAVSDTGQGIPPESLESVFAPFYRGNGPKVPGSGLGLAIVKELVESQRGRIWVESEVGVGTTFHFTLPEEMAS